MGTETAERQFHAAIFQRKLSKMEIETEILQLEKKFRKADKTGNISLMFDIQDELGIMYNRLMKIQRIQNKYLKN